MDLLYWIWLSLRCGAGSESGSFLLTKFNTPKDIFDLDEDAIRKIDGIDEDLKTSLCDKDLSRAEKTIEFCGRKNVHIITPESAEYPDRLKSIHAKPLVLYYVGRLPKIDEEPLIACVGTRTYTDHGFATAYKLGAELTYAGATVVSGLASGIDSACARGALSIGGNTIAVIGCGIDVVYPRDNLDLYRAIAKHGAIITEYAPQTSPSADHFPVRNRIISGLSIGTCVVEASAKSGALITARHAETQGRNVYAFPGRAGDDESAGNLGLIYNGAKLVRCAADIVKDLESLYPTKLFKDRIPSAKYVSGKIKGITVPVKKEKEEKPKRRRKTPEPEEVKNESIAQNVDTSSLTDVERAVFDALHDHFNPDEIRVAASKALGKNVGASEILSSLTTLEILGYCRALPGGNYSLT